MAFNDPVTLSYVAFRQHVNLGGESSRTLSRQGALCTLELLPNGMIRVQKLGKTFFVASVVIESCEAAENQPKTAPNTVTGSSKGAKSGKRAHLEPDMSRADAILAELGHK
jgi:hypothetical protein